MVIAGRTIRASWTQIFLYAIGILGGLKVFFSGHPLVDFEMSNPHVLEVWTDLLLSIGSSVTLISARSPIGRKEWTPPERAEKTLAEGEGTPPSN